MAISFEEHPQIFANETLNIDIPEKLSQCMDGKMQKVPPVLRLDRNNLQDYDPLVVSLGPYHHGKKELQLAEDFKLTALEMFVNGSSRKRNFSTYRYGKEQGEKMLNEFIEETVFGECKGSGIASRGEKLLPLHLLDAFRQVLVSESISQKPSSNHEDSRFSLVKHMGNSAKCSHFCQYISNWSCFPWRKGSDNDNSTKKYVHSFRSATDLKAKGIHFRPSNAASLKRIKFKPGYFYAVLEVPIWFVSIHTKVFFLNMIAYEMCPNSDTDKAVTAYIEFMKSLIDSPKDVKELRDKGILMNTLGSDEEVEKVYKEINTHGVTNVGIFHDVKEEIQAHYNNKAKTWLAELFYTYFRSPWTALALFAATFLLVLTFLQTYYTLRPS